MLGKTLYSTLPSIYRKDTFADEEIFQRLYSVLGDKLGDAYRSVAQTLIDGSLDSAELYRVVKCQGIPATDLDFHTHSMEIAPGEFSTTTIVALPGYVAYGAELVTRSLTTDLGLESPYYFSIVDEAEDLEALRNRVGDLELLRRSDRFLVLHEFPLDVLELDGAPAFKPESDFITRVGGFTAPLEGRFLNPAAKLTEGTRLKVVSGDSTYECSLASDAVISLGSALLSIEYSSSSIVSSDPVTIFLGSELVSNAADPIVGTSPVEERWLWLRNCRVDRLDLYYRFGEPFGEPIASSETYRGVLKSLWELSTSGPVFSKVSKAVSILYGVPTLLDPPEFDPIQYIDYEQRIVKTGLRTHRLDSTFPLSEVVALSAASHRSGYSEVDGDIVSLELTSTQDLRFLLSDMGLPSEVRPSSGLSIRDTQDLSSSVLCRSERGFILNKPSGSASISGDLQLVSSEHGVLFTIDSEDYTISAAGSKAYTVPQPIQQVASVRDSISHPNWWKSSIAIPYELFRDTERRRTVRSRVWDLVIGQMPEHRVGDYGLRVGLEEQHEVAYLLMRDFLAVKSLLVTLDGTSSALGRVRSTVETLKPLLKTATTALMSAVATTFYNFFKEPTEGLEIYIIPPGLSDRSLAVSVAYGDEGVGAVPNPRANGYNVIGSTLSPSPGLVGGDSPRFSQDDSDLGQITSTIDLVHDIPVSITVTEP